MEFLASRSPLLPAFVVLGLLFYVINSWFAARSAAEQKRRLADAP